MGIVIGDVVQLRSGSCDMTVTHIVNIDGDGDGDIICTYYGIGNVSGYSVIGGCDSKSIQVHNYKPECLVVTQPLNKQTDTD